MRAAIYRFRMPPGPGFHPQGQSFLRSCLAMLIGLVAFVFACVLALFLFLAGLVAVLFFGLRRLFLRKFRGGAWTRRDRTDGFGWRYPFGGPTESARNASARHSASQATGSSRTDNPTATTARPPRSHGMGSPSPHQEDALHDLERFHGKLDEWFAGKRKDPPRT